MGRAPCCEKSGLKKGPWTPEEDQKLIDYILKNGYGNWRTLPKNAGLDRCGKSCRLRWTNYLRPDIKRGRFSFEEEETIIQLHSILGNKWSAIAARLPGRTDNEIKNFWNTHIRKRLLRMGIDPVTHSPRLDLLELSSILYQNNQTSSRLMAMHQSSTHMTHPDILRIATSLMSSQSDNPVTNFYHQTQLDSFDPTRMIQDQYYYDSQHELDHHDQSLIQILALQKQVAEYGQSAQFQSNVTISYPSSHDSDYVPIPFTDLYGSDQTQILNTVFLGQPDGHNLISMNNSVNSSTPNSNIIT